MIVKQSFSHIPSVLEIFFTLVLTTALCTNSISQKILYKSLCLSLYSVSSNKGNTTANAFPVDIDKDQLVGHLKKVIKAEKQNDLASVDADKLKLSTISEQFLTPRPA
jgi:hypothetical protein